jgi:hypothetical protein
MERTSLDLIRGQLAHAGYDGCFSQRDHLNPRIAGFTLTRGQSSTPFDDEQLIRLDSDLGGLCFLHDISAH